MAETIFGKPFADPPFYNGLDKTVEGFALDARQGKALSDSITALNSKITTKQLSITIETNITGTLNGYRSGNVCVLNIDISYTGATNVWTKIGTLSSNDKPVTQTRGIIKNANNNALLVRVTTSRNIEVYVTSVGDYSGELVYLV